MRREQEIHKAIVEHLRWRGVPGLVFLHPANGGFRTPAEAAILQGLGVRAGASDLLLWHDNRSFAFELKSEGGRTTEAQLQFLADMKNAGAFAGVAVGIDDALAVLKAGSCCVGG
jgi:VRR-NUC domain-containing protein